MSDEKRHLCGAFRYLTFGCRQNWVEESLETKGRLPKGLGPRQIVALRNYLHDAGVQHIGSEELTETGQMLRQALQTHSPAVWEVIWTNWTQRSALFSSWATVPCGEYTRDQCRALLSERFCTSAERSVRDAMAALVGTLRRSPVGDVLGQGTVVGTGRTWTIVKTGPGLPVPWWALYSMALMSPQSISMNADDRGDHSDVAQVLGVSDGVLSAALESLWQPDLFTVSRDGGGFVHADLRSGVTPETVLRRWINQQ